MYAAAREFARCRYTEQNTSASKSLPILVSDPVDLTGVHVRRSGRPSYAHRPASYFVRCNV